MRISKQNYVDAASGKSVLAMISSPVADAPYPELVAASRDIASGMYRRRFSSPPPSGSR